MLIFNPILLYGQYGSTTNQTSRANPSVQTVKCSLSFRPCTLKISLKWRSLKTKHPKHRSHNESLLLCFFKAEWWGGRQIIVAGDKEIDFITRTEKMLLLPWWTESQKLGLTEQMCSCFLPHLYANIKCILFQCLPYLPMPCYAVHMCCRTRLISLLLAEWIKKTQIHCFSSVYAPPFM